LELSHTSYKINAGLFQKAHEKINYYAFADKYPYLEMKKLWMSKFEHKISSAITFDCNVFTLSGLWINSVVPHWDFHRLNFYQSSEFFHLSRSLERVYNQNNAAIFAETATNYYYENMNHLQMTKSVSSTDHSIDSLTTVYKYPLDYNIPAGATDAQSLAIKKMQELHIVAEPIEIYSTLTRNALGLPQVVNGAKLNNFELKNVNGIIFPMKTGVKTANLLTPSGLYINFVPSSINSVGNFEHDINYQNRTLFSYTDNGSVLSQRKVDDAPKTYIWGGTDRAYPIAEVVNTEADQVIHTSFEDEPTAVIWGTSAKTGNKVYQLTTSTSLLLQTADLGYLALGEYTLTFWAKGTGTNLKLGYASIPVEFDTDWKFNKVRISVGGSTVAGVYNVGYSSVGLPLSSDSPSGSIFIDELRIYPDLSLMNTYTYLPLIGLQSVTDPNHVTSYYEYDAYGRMRLVRDFNKFILSRQKYIYNGILPCPDEY
jgi:hypothetical protein